jgi:chromosome segregation ATPase
MLEKENNEFKQRIQELETGKTEDRILFLEKQWELLHDKLGFLQSHVQKIEREHESTKSCLNTNCQDIGKIERESQRNTIKTDAVYKRLGEYNEDVQRLEETLKNYKQDNELLNERLQTVSDKVWTRERDIGTLRLRIIDVSDQTEKVEGEVKEIKQIASYVYFKNREYDKTFHCITDRMDELELALKSVSIHNSSIQQIIERLSALENLDKR